MFKNKHIQRFIALLTHDHISSLVSNLVFSTSAFLSFILLSRNIPPEVFGSWILFLSLSSFIDMIVMGLTRNAVIFYGCGEDEHLRHQYNAASFMAMVVILLIVSIVFIPLSLFGKGFIPEVWRTIFLLYPLLGLTSLWRMSSLSFLQAKAQYHKTIGIRLINTLLFLALCALLLILGKVTFINLIAIYILASMVSSLYGMWQGWDSMKYVKEVSRTHIRQVLNYGKYTLFTNLGSSLLKSADVFIIGLSPVLGVVGVAVYSIPFKLVEIIEIPLRSLAMSSFNRISVLSKDKDYAAVGRLFVRYNLILSLLFLPMMGCFLLFPGFILTILGGEQYHSYMHEMTIIVYIIVVYGYMMIPDRLIGVTLEGIGRPRGNTIKTFLMTVFNVVGNLVAIFWFQSLIGVALASLGFTMLGIVLGFLFIRDSGLSINGETILVEVSELRRNGRRLLQKVF